MRTEKFNPYEHLTICQTAAGEFIMEPVEQNGLPVLIEDDKGSMKLVQMPKTYLNRFALTEWFWSEFPDGGITDELDSCREWNGESFIYSDELSVKVTLLSDREKNTVLSTAYGIVKRIPSQEDRKDVFPFAAEFQGKDGPYRLAYYIALKTAMERAGFIYYSDYETLKEKLPFFLETVQTGPVSKWVPLDKSQVLSAEKENLQNVKAEESKYEVVKDASEEQKPAKAAISSTAPVAGSGAKDALAYIAAMSAPSEEKAAHDEMPEWLAEPAEDEKSPASDPLAEAKNVIYHVIPEGVQNERLALMEGKRLGELDAKTIQFIATRPALVGQLTEETISAAKVLAGIL